MNKFKRIGVCLIAVLMNAQWLVTASAIPDASDDLSSDVYRVHLDDRDENGLLLPVFFEDAQGNCIPIDRPTVSASDETFPSSYDARKHGLVTSVKNQTVSGSCWSFAAISAAESDYIRKGYDKASKTDFSESHLVWFANRSRTDDVTDSLYGDGKLVPNPYSDGYNNFGVMATLMRGSGLLFEKKAPWRFSLSEPLMLTRMRLSEEQRYDCDVRVIGAQCILNPTNDHIKRAVMEHGSATISFYYEKKYRNRLNGAYYQTAESYGSNHDVCVVGWDDSYSKDNFLEPRPETDGAWLVKNSWGRINAKSGYNWISYEEKTVDRVVTYDTATGIDYDTIYQYDGSKMDSSILCTGTAKMANFFTAKKTELLTHVAFYSMNTTESDVSVQVYRQTDPASHNIRDPFSDMEPAEEAVTVQTDGFGYRTVELPEPVRLEPGQIFAVVVTLSEDGSAEVRIPTERAAADINRVDPLETNTAFSMLGESYYYKNGVWRMALYSVATMGSVTTRPFNVPVKAMTRELDETEREPTLEVVTAPTRLHYSAGEEIDWEGMTLRFTDAKGNEQIVESGFQASDSVVRHNGENTVILSYKGARTAVRVEGEGAMEMHVRRPATQTLYSGDQLTLTAEPVGAADGMQVVWTEIDEDGHVEPLHSCIVGEEPLTLLFSTHGKKSQYIYIAAFLMDENGEYPERYAENDLRDSVRIDMRCGLFYRLTYPIRWLFGLVRKG